MASLTLDRAVLQQSLQRARLEEAKHLAEANRMNGAAEFIEELLKLPDAPVPAEAPGPTEGSNVIPIESLRFDPPPPPVADNLVQFPVAPDAPSPA